MSIFNKIEQFPLNHENVEGVIVPTTLKDTQAMAYASLQLENIFNDNARIKS
jgi:hypothetical protein